MSDEQITQGVFVEFRRSLDRVLSDHDRRLEAATEKIGAREAVINEFRTLQQEWAAFRDTALPGLRDRITRAELRIGFIAAGGGAFGAAAVEIVQRLAS